MSSQARRRVIQLEEAAARLHWAPYRAEIERIARELRQTPEQVIAGAEGWGRRIDAMGAAGMTSDQITAAFADEIGVPVDDLVRECGAIQAQ